MSTTGVRFCLAVPKSLKHPKYSDNTYQVRVAHRLAECLKTSIMENRLMSTFVPTDRQINIECDDQPVFTSCCTIDETPTDLNNCGHSTHFVLIYIPKLWLKQCASLLRPDLSIDKQELNNCVQKLTDGQTAWLAELAIRSLVLSKAHIKSLVCDLGLSLNLIDNIDEYILSNRPALFILEYLGLISNLTRSHDKMERRSIWTDHFSTLNVFPNSEKLRQYLGDSIGFYFVWMKSYCVYLTCPLIAGLFCQVFNLLNGQHFEDKQVSLGIHLVYTIFMILWAVICTKLWQREYISCVDRWSGNALIELAANDLAWLFNFIDQRPTFHGTWRQSRVTGLMELHYPAAKRRLRYVASGFITLACLLWAIFVNIALLNMETNKDYERALIIKRFLFELVDAYGGLIYLGFILADRLALRSLLLTMFATDSIRRLTLECIIPYIIYRFRAWKEKQSIGLIKRNHNSEKPMYQIRVERELCADIYESFDDYLEMVLQHGYLVLFAYASPLFITILAILCTFLEIHFDVFKLFWVTQCPKSNLLLREQSIWLLLLGIQAWLSVLTNAGLLISEIHRLEILTDVTASTIFLIFEHCLIFIALCIHFLISDTPVTVRDARLARDFARARLLSPKKDN
ncbi:unnamed protein product [Schistosoma haematobium]|nr:unnamed protein product [Schistosoma haematobium]CAH8550289.1 unnamed protein product [Schistosoma haematobium]